MILYPVRMCMRTEVHNGKPDQIFSCEEIRVLKKKKLVSMGIVKCNNGFFFILVIVKTGLVFKAKAQKAL